MESPNIEKNQSEIDLKASINSLNKKNSDLLELIEQLSLKNIEVTKTNDLLRNEIDERDKFFSILSHDLRGQMGNMINSSDLLVHSFDDLDFTDIRSILKMLNNSIRKNYTLLDNLLLWASIKRGVLNLKIEQVNAREAINFVLENFGSKINQKSINIQNRINDDVLIKADLKYFEIVFSNILSNSIKFSEKGQKIEIDYNKENDSLVEIIVSDQGIGIDEEIFNNLYKIDKIHSSYSTEKETGSGMGLLITKSLLNKMEGELNIETGTEGTRVSIFCKRG